MQTMARMAMAMAGLLIGLGIAIFVKAVSTVGFDELVLGHIVGPGLVAAGIARIKLQRTLDGHPHDHDAGGEDGGAP